MTTPQSINAARPSPSGFQEKQMINQSNDDNPFVRFAREKGHRQRLPLMKFRKGKFFVGTDEVPLGREFIAVVSELRYGFVKFVNNEHAGEHIIRVADGVAWPRREDIGDHNKALWERDNKGEPKDPWIEQYYLPLQDFESGEHLAFVAPSTSKGSYDAVADLLWVYGNNTSKGLPIIALGVGGYKHKRFGWVDTPKLKIIGWHPIVASVASTGKKVLEAPATDDVPEEITGHLDVPEDEDVF
jgi:hypothetical protein